MDKIKTIALVAHDNRKADMAEWVAYNADKLSAHHLICTGTTGKMVEETSNWEHCSESPFFTMYPLPATVPQPISSSTRSTFQVLTKILKDYSKYINRNI